ncbi:MAG: hypothetical protein HYV09_02505 [Deltaproteobacteria bacterium]|nr:hypothetical protein [Deltaproteobacteria bacterium]
MRAFLFLPFVGALVVGCSARTPIERDRTNTGEYCPITVGDGLRCPKSQEGCTFFRPATGACLETAVCRCEEGLLVECKSPPGCATLGSDPLLSCAPGVPCGATKFGCVVESCGRSCLCGADGRWQCAPDAC